MPSFKNIAGQRFGRWTVIEETERNEKGRRYYICQCDCGKKKNVSLASLHHNSKSCGCLKREVASKKYTKDLTNKVFGCLTVIKPTDKRERGSVVWECLCICEKTVYSCSRHLISGHTLSCGRCGKIKDLTEQIFGYLVVLRPTDKRAKSGQVFWECRCNCGNIKLCRSDSLQDGTVTSCGCRVISNLEEQTEQALINLELQYKKQVPLIQNKKTPFLIDFVIIYPKNTFNEIAIECQGRQHFEPIDYFGGRERFIQDVERDKRKRALLESMGYTLIEVRYDCPNIEKFLKEKLNECKQFIC